MMCTPCVPQHQEVLVPLPLLLLRTTQGTPTVERLCRCGPLVCIDLIMLCCCIMVLGLGSCGNLTQTRRSVQWHRQQRSVRLHSLPERNNIVSNSQTVQFSPRSWRVAARVVIHVRYVRACRVHVALSTVTEAAWGIYGA